VTTHLRRGFHLRQGYGGQVGGQARARIVLGILIAVITAAGVGLVRSGQSLEPRLHAWVTETLSRSLEGDVQLESVHLNWIPLRLRGQNLIVRHHGRTDIPPLLSVGSFSVDLRPMDLWSSTVDHVKVDGLEISIPPKDAGTGTRPIPRPSQQNGRSRDSDGLVVRRLTATNTRLAIVPRIEGKNAKVWDIFELDMKNLGNGESATFTAALINPIPYGKIESTGTFGPWQAAEPGDTPLTGEYTFAADLGTIEGLAGQLNASGAMTGTIDEISTHGETHTPDFRLTELDGISLPLNTSYDALVDGTKGDVELRRVDVTLGNSKFHARGLVEGTKGVRGKRVVVNVTSAGADLGELLQLVSKATRPPAQGNVIIDTAFDLPQGKEPVLDRLSLEGSVRADRVMFTSDLVQGKIDELSRRGRGRPDDPSIDDVASRMTTKFALKDGVFTYQGLSFEVQGATIRLDGTHSLRSKAVDLSGVVLLKAAASKTQTGFKSWLLKPFDPLFRKNGAGTRLAIKVAGTQDQPKVGLELRRTLKGQ
jgi:hypothetical protein